jgi:hypothetical protein
MSLPEQDVHHRVVGAEDGKVGRGRGLVGADFPVQLRELDDAVPWCP